MIDNNKFRYQISATLINLTICDLDRNLEGEGSTSVSGIIRERGVPLVES